MARRTSPRGRRGPPKRGPPQGHPRTAGAASAAASAVVAPGGAPIAPFALRPAAARRGRRIGPVVVDGRQSARWSWSPSWWRRSRSAPVCAVMRLVPSWGSSPGGSVPPDYLVLSTSSHDISLDRSIATPSSGNRASTEPDRRHSCPVPEVGSSGYQVRWPEELAGVVVGAGPGHVEALGPVAAELAQRGQLGGRLDAFGHRHQAEACGPG